MKNLKEEDEATKKGREEIEKFNEKKVTKKEI
jgi:hypothetical protein